MPKISVHLEADSAEEFLALLGSFKINTSRPVEVEAPVLTAIIKKIEAATPEPAQAPPVEAPAEPVKPKRGRPAKAAPVEPEPEPPVVVQPEPPVAQPAAAVVAAPEIVVPKPAKAAPKAKEPEIVVSRQDLLDAFSEYVQRYGASFGFSDISSLLQKNLGDGVRKASDVPEDKLPVAIGAIKTAIADNPFNRKRDYA